DWTGRVCTAPAANHSCAILKNVKDAKDSDAEEVDAGKAWADLAETRVPPCVFERGGFMRSKPFSITREHAYAHLTRSHAHFDKTTQFMPAYSFEATPFRWTMRSEVEGRVQTWGIGYEAAYEEAADQIIEFGDKTEW